MRGRNNASLLSYVCSSYTENTDLKVVQSVSLIMAESTITTNAFHSEDDNAGELEPAFWRLIRFTDEQYLIVAAMPKYLRRLDDEEGYQPLGSVDIIWTNLYDSSDFQNVRFKSNLPIAQLLVKLGKSIESGAFDHVFNVSALRFALFVTVSTTKGLDELRDIVFLNL
jgi:hypothetical protein